MLLETLRREALERAADRMLLEAELYNSTPALVGSWTGSWSLRSLRGRLHLAEPPRPTDIAGKARWWLRAILAAGYWRVFQGFPRLHHLNQLASRMMGDTREASRYLIRVEPLQAGMVCAHCAAGRRMAGACLEPHPDADSGSLDPCEYTQRILELRRVKLATLAAKEPLERLLYVPLPPGFYRFTLRVERRPTPPRHRRDRELEELEDKIFGTALGMALFFTGIGRMVTRGYGKLAPAKPIEGDSPLAQAVRETLKRLQDGDLLSIADEASHLAADYLEKADAKPAREQRCLPSYPVFHRRFIGHTIWRPQTNNIINILKTIDKLTSLKRLARYLSTLTGCGNVHFYYLQSILGLPRTKPKRSYIILPQKALLDRLLLKAITWPRNKKDILQQVRYPSPLMFSPIKSNNIQNGHLQSHYMVHVTYFWYLLAPLHIKIPHSHRNRKYTNNIYRDDFVLAQQIIEALRSVFNRQPTGYYGCKGNTFLISTLPYTS